MRKKIRKPSFSSEKVVDSSWKDHPIIIGAAAFGTAITLMGSVIFPLLTSHLTSQLEEARSGAELQKKEIENLNVAVEKLNQNIKEKIILSEKISKESEAVSEELRKYKISNPFFLPGVYPRGLESVRVGSSIADVEKAYESFKIDKKNDDYWSIEVDHPVFSRATYYFDLEKDKVTHILFHTKYKGPIKDEDWYFLAKQYFGKPFLEAEKNYLWKNPVSSGEYLSIEDEKLVLIYDKNIVPGWMIRAFGKCQKQSEINKNNSEFCKIPSVNKLINMPKSETEKSNK